MNEVPYEWFALLEAFLGGLDEVLNFEYSLRNIFDYAINNKKLNDFPLIISGSPGTGKTTIGRILELGCILSNQNNIAFIHDADLSNGRISEELQNYISNFSAAIIETNRYPIPDDDDNLDSYDTDIFYTTGNRFTPKVYQAIVEVCEAHASDIYKHYARL